jgi:DNA-binding XRE family transcriptional regulator
LERFSGAKLKAARRAAGLTREELAQFVGMSYKSVVGWEQSRKTPLPESRLAIADVVSVPVESLHRGVS